MDPEQREILIARRVELVEDIDIQGGLFTQLLSRKVLQKRAVSKIRLNRTPEEQVEELLNELPKRECFEDFCDALIADGQEHIVKKYLKATLPTPAKPQQGDKAAVAAPAAPSQSQQESSPCPAQAFRSSDEGGSAESTDSFVNFGPMKRAHTAAAPNSTAVICIREEDNQHLYIRYTDDGATPEKRQRALEATPAAPVVFEPDETRYAMKHYVSQESNSQGDKSLVLHQASGALSSLMVLNNPQSVTQNPNIVDPLRYSAAFAANRQWSSNTDSATPSHPSQIIAQTSIVNPATATSAPSSYENAGFINIHPSMNPGIQLSAAAAPPSSLSSPLKDPSSLVNKQGAETAHIRSLLQPQPGQAFLNVDHLKSVRPETFARLKSGADSGQFQDPQQYLTSAGLLTPSKGLNSARPPSLSRNDSVDTAMMGSPAKSVHVNVEQQGLNVSALSDFNDSLDSGVLGTENVIKCATGMMATPSPLPVPAVGGADGACDMDQIDLPDGCVNVKVEHCTRQFFLANHKKAYPMRQIPRGLALIINVDEVEGKQSRKGTNFDRDNLCNLLCQLHFNIIVYNDKDGLSAQEMVNKLKDFAKLPEHADMDACFVCLLSHGEEGFIFGTDGKRIPLEEIFMLFGNTNCRGLIGKPKVFIIQACRGGYLDKGVRMDEPDGGSVLSNPPTAARGPGGGGASPQQLPSMSDMLVCYPTLTGYYAWRNRARGSWYIEAIVQVFMRYAKCEDICAMLNRVNQLVSKKVSECNQKEMNAMSQMSEYKSSLRQPHLFLFPGIGICMKPPQ